jgi:hypothetical protein
MQLIAVPIPARLRRSCIGQYSAEFGGPVHPDSGTSLRIFDQALRLSILPATFMPAAWNTCVSTTSRTTQTIMISA